MRASAFWAWVPGVLLTLGAAVTVGVNTQRALPLRADLASVVPATFDSLVGRDEVIDPDVLRVAGVDAYLFRVYEGAQREAEAGATGFSVYIGYYEEQARGRTIHSPKNCLPGAGWEALTSSTTTVPTANGPVKVNRYLIQQGDAQALVLYWYQGRGRVAANEYRVKYDLLRDSALRGRSDEALVRIVVPVVRSTEEAQQEAVSYAAALIPSLYRALPPLHATTVRAAAQPSTAPTT